MSKYTKHNYDISEKVNFRAVYTKNVEIVQYF